MRKDTLFTIMWLVITVAVNIGIAVALGKLIDNIIICLSLVYIICSATHTLFSYWYWLVLAECYMTNNRYAEKQLEQARKRLFWKRWGRMPKVWKRKIKNSMNFQKADV